MKDLIVVCLLFAIALAYGFEPISSKPYLTPTSSPTNSINVNWNTENLAPTQIAYGLTPDLEDTVNLAGLRNYHHIKLGDLLPDTKYFYRILPFGDVKAFTTFPLESDSFSFVVYGDTRGDSSVHQSVINGMASFNFRFLIHTGDLVNDGDNADNWREFFNVADTLLQFTHFLPALGNHEKPYWPYDTFFALPDSEYFYSVRYGNAFFIVLNSEFDIKGFQREWLISELTAARKDSTLDWLFVAFHRPVYSAGRYGDRPHIREAWAHILEEYDVDIVFAGHDHNYQRTDEIKGVTYIITGGGSAPLYGVDMRRWLAYAEATHHFCLVRIMGSKLILEAIKPDGTVFDQLVMDNKQR
jgi:hypothetical protein